MADQTTPTVGKLLTGTEGRDAIHFALAPVVASEILRPGQEVGRNGSIEGPMLGIVDPFLKQDVLPGQRFWLFLFPGTITSLRHVWAHPAFEIKVSR